MSASAVRSAVERRRTDRSAGARRAPTRSFGAALVALAMALVPLALVPLGACGAVRATPVWVEETIESPSEQVLWEFCLSALANQGFSCGSGANPGKLEIVSNWKKDLQAFKGKGTRKRATLKLERLGDGRYGLSVRVEVEVNQDITKPLDPTFAKWEVAPDDPASARIIAATIVARSGVPLEIRPDAEAEGIESWQSLAVRADTQNELLVAVDRTLLALGYPLRKMPGVDPRLVQTNWNVQLSPSPGRGRRVRATVRVQLLGAGRYRVRALVERQMNADRQNPMDPGAADWTEPVEDRDLTIELLESIRDASER